MATTISLMLPPSLPPPPYTSLLTPAAARPRTLSLSSLRTNPAFMSVSTCACNLIYHLPSPGRTGIHSPRDSANNSNGSHRLLPFLLGKISSLSPQWLSVLLLRVHQNALVAKWLNTWQWLPSTSSATSASSLGGGSYETAWLRGWVAARQHYVMSCWDAVWLHILHPSSTFKLPNLETKKRKLSLPPPPSTTSTSTSSDSDVPDPEKLGSNTRSHETTYTTVSTTLTEKPLIVESILPVEEEVDSLCEQSPVPAIIQVRLPPTTRTSLKEVQQHQEEPSSLRSIDAAQDPAPYGDDDHAVAVEVEEEILATGASSPVVCDSGYASSSEVDEACEQDAGPTFIDSPVIRKHAASLAYFEVTSTSTSSDEEIPLYLDASLDPLEPCSYPTTYNDLPIPKLTITPCPDEPVDYLPVQLSYGGTFLSVPAKECYESLVHARRALRCTIVGWWGEVPDEDEEQRLVDEEHEEELRMLGCEEMCVEDMVYWLDDDEEELPDLPDDW